MWAFYRDVFGYWRWEHLDAQDCRFARESSHGFPTRAACVEDAADHGYDTEDGVELTSPHH